MLQPDLLPIQPAPQAGEAMPGYIRRLAYANGRGAGWLLDAFGISTGDHGLGLYLENRWSQPDAIAKWRQTFKRQLPLLTTAEYEGLCGVGTFVQDSDLIKSIRRFPATCLFCLEQQPDLFLLRWWDPWSFVCLEHAVWLAPEPARWIRPNRDDGLGRGDQPATASPNLLRTQKLVEELRPGTGEITLDELLATGLVADNLRRTRTGQAQLRETPGRTRLTSPQRIGECLRQGCDLTSGDPGIVATRQQQFRDQVRQLSAYQKSRIYRQRRVVGPLRRANISDGDIGLRTHRLHRREATRHSSFDLDQWPQLMPESLFTPDIADDLHYLSWPVARHVAILLCTRAVGIKVAEACTALNLPGGAVKANGLLHRHTRALEAAGRYDVLWERLRDLAPQLDRGAGTGRWGDRRRRFLNDPDRVAASVAPASLDDVDARELAWYAWTLSYPPYMDGGNGRSRVGSASISRALRLADFHPIVEQTVTTDETAAS